MLLNLTDLSSESIKDQIAWQIIDKVLKGELNSGDELIPVNSLSRKQRVNKAAVKHVYENLKYMGIVEFKNEYGYFVKELSDELRNDLLQKFSRRKRISVRDGQRDTTDYIKFERELLVARQIQAELLPDNYWNEKEFELASSIEPSRIVCGDFYDYFKISEDKIGLVIADACGKGIPAALLISQIQAILKSDISNGPDCSKILNKLNQYLVNNISSRNFTTLLYGLYHIRTGEFEYANAGQNYPIVIRSSSTFELLKTTGPALGLLKNFDYKTDKILLNPDDTICFYTDGITETMDEHGDQFGEGRLIELLIALNKQELNEVIAEVTNAVKDFTSTKQLSDDKTIMMLKTKITMTSN